MKKNQFRLTLLAAGVAITLSSISCNSEKLTLSDIKEEKEQAEPNKENESETNNPTTGGANNGEGTTTPTNVVTELPKNLTLPKGFTRTPARSSLFSGYNDGDIIDGTLPPPGGGGSYPGPVLDKRPKYNRAQKWVANARQGGVLLERTFNVEYDAGTSEQLIFDHENDQIFIGNVLLAGQLREGSFTPLAEQVTQDVTISTRLITQGAPIQSRTFRPSLSGYNDVYNDWLSNSFKENPSRTITEFKEVILESNFGLSSGANIDTEALSMIASLDVNIKKKKTHILFKMIQSAFSVAMDNPKGFFLLDFDKKSLDGHVPVYVSNIEYGRAYYVLFSSDYSATEVKAAFKLNPKSPENPLKDFFTEIGYSKIRQETNVSSRHIGGSALDHNAIISNGWEAYKAQLSNIFPLSTAEPIAYGFRYVDTNQQAAVKIGNNRHHKQTLFVPDCKEITIKMRPDAIRSTAGFKGIGAIRLSGKGEMRCGTHRVKFLNKSASEQFKVAKSTEEFTQLPETAFPWVDFTIRMPMDMERQLDKDVEISLDLKQAGIYGTSTEDLGSTSFTISLTDLLFYAQNGGFTIKTRQNRLMDYQGELHIAMKPFTVSK